VYPERATQPAAAPSGQARTGPTNGRR